MYYIKINNLIAGKKYVVFHEVDWKGRILERYAVPEKWAESEFNKKRTEEEIPVKILNTVCTSIPGSKYKEQIYQGNDYTVMVVVHPNTGHWKISWDKLQ